MSESIPRDVDAAQLRALAARLDASPRDLLALAARLASSAPDDRIDRARIDGELARIRADSDQTEAAVGMLLLGYAAFASDDIDRALEMVWRGADVGMP